MQKPVSHSFLSLRSHGGEGLLRRALQPQSAYTRGRRSPKSGRNGSVSAATEDCRETRTRRAPDARGALTPPVAEKEPEQKSSRDPGGGSWSRVQRATLRVTSGLRAASVER